MLNIHHLELFYYVARHGGVSAAARNMPYGIQQPAISGQILQLEEDLGGPLFQRRPFALTPAGDQLFAFIKPFFDGIDGIEEKLRGGTTQTIRLAASTIVLRDHLPDLLTALRPKFPRLKLFLREGLQPQIERWLADQEIDFGVTVMDGQPPPGIQAEPLMELAMELVAPRSLRLTSAEELFARDRIAEPLILPPANETLTKRFQETLTRRGIFWPASIEVNSMELIASYAAAGFGIGLSVAVPGKKYDRRLRALPLVGFKPITVAVLHQPSLPSVALALIGEMRRRAAQMIGK